VEDVMDLSSMLFVYVRLGAVVVTYLDDAKEYEDHPEWEHIATLEPRAYVEHLLNDDSETLNRLRD